MPEHSPEPWRQNVCSGWGQEVGILDANGRQVFLGDDLSPEDCQRIVACVNFCQNFRTSFLEGQKLLLPFKGVLKPLN